MKLLHNIRIRTKLALLIAMMILGIVAVGVIGYHYNAKSNTALENIYSKNTLAIVKLSDARTQSRANFANILNLIVTEDEEGKQDILADFEERKGKITDDYTEYAKTERSDDELKLYMLIQGNQRNWNDISDKIVNLITSGQKDEAVDLFKKTGEPTFEELQTSIRNLVDYNTNLAETKYQENKKDGDKASLLLVAAILSVSVIAVILGVIITMAITRSIYSIVKIIDRTAKLDLHHDETNQVFYNYKDETGAIARSVGELREALRSIAGNITAVSTNLAASSEEMAASTEESTKTISQVVNSVNEIAVGNNAQAQSIAKTSETVLSMVADINKVNDATITNSANAKQSMVDIEEGQRAINLTMDKVIENRKVSHDVEESISELSNQMDRVVGIIDVIGSISEQTNLLALNASIEAARAGEAGRGFAVVAAEISKLSKSTAEAVKEITDIITAAVSRNNDTAENTALARKITVEQEQAILVTKEVFTKIRESVDTIAEQTIEISAKVAQIDASAVEISNQTQDMSAVAQEAAAGSEEISATNEEQLAAIEMIASAANDLSVMATELNNEISKFIL
jgi:methyl-accepting chemotaxis protein